MIEVRHTRDLAQAGPLLARAIPRAVDGEGAQLGDLIAGCQVFELLDAGRVVGAFAARCDSYSDGRVLTVTAAGGLPGYDLTAAMNAWLTLQASGPAAARRLQCVTRRPGLIKKLKTLGFHEAGVIMAKDI